MSMLIAEQEGVLVAMPGTRLDTNNSSEAESILLESIQNNKTRIIIDFSKTDYISSAGLRIILKTARLLKEKEGSFAMCQANEQILEVLEISGFLEIIDYFPSFKEAVESFSD